MTRNLSPVEGDIIILEARDSTGAYEHIEEVSGREVRIYSGDLVVGILGTRKSGTNLIAHLPSGPLVRGDVLQLAAVGGLFGHVSFTPKYFGKPPQNYATVGFFPSEYGGVVNIKDGQPARNVDADAAPTNANVTIIFVTGSSAEAGKTTFVCSAIRHLRTTAPEIRIGALKVCGTGRMRDGLRYKDAGANTIRDFVDEGWASTYNITAGAYAGVLADMIAHVAQTVDVILVEVGGDLLEACAPVAIAYAAREQCAVVYCVNDAMGARAGLEIFRGLGIENLAVATLNQNPDALGQRLAFSHVFDPSELQQVGVQVDRILQSPTRSIHGT